MVFKTGIILFNYCPILIFALCLSGVELLGQDIPSFVEKVDVYEYSAKDYYDFILDLNERSTSIVSRGLYEYQLDSIYGYIPSIQVQFEDLQGSQKYFFADSKEVDFGQSCFGSDCILSPDSYSIEQLDDKGRFLSRSGTLWDGESYDYDCDLTSGSVFIYDEDLVRTMNYNFGLIKDTLIYDDEDKLILLQRFFRADVLDTFRLDSYFNYSYDDESRLESIVDMDYRSNFGRFIPEDSIHYNYYDNGLLLLLEEFYIQALDPVSWKKSEVYHYTYNNDGLINEIKFYNALNSDSTWAQQELAGYSYNTEGSLDTITYYDIRDPYNIRPIFRKEYSYDRSVLLSEIIMPWRREPLEGQQHMLIMEHNYEIDYPYINRDLVGTPGIIEFYYNLCDDVHTDDPIEIGLGLWPNPVLNTISLTSEREFFDAEISIYDISGTLRHSSSLKTGEPIDVSYLAPGTYIIHALLEEYPIIFKFIKL